MSYCKNEGKDRVIFATEEDHSTPSKVSFPENDEDDTPAGLLLPNGEINWSCPCLGGMATGPCGVEFRDSFTCFHYSTEDPKGSECLDAFRTMSECMSQYPGVYGSKNDDEDIFKDNEDELKEDLPEEDSKESSVKSSSSHDSTDSSSLSKEVVKS